MKASLDEVVQELGRSIAVFPWEDPQTYARWLAQTYHYVSHSTRLLAAAAARMPLSALGNQLHYRCAAHMAEEKKHELLAAHDLKTLGFRLEDFPVLPITRMFYEPQYVKIEREDPIALFGYILVLEAMSAQHGPENLRRVVQAHGKRAAAFLEVHANEDGGHVEKALASLASVDASKLMFVEQNIQQTGFAYAMLLRTIGKTQTVSDRRPAPAAHTLAG